MTNFRMQWTPVGLKLLRKLLLPGYLSLLFIYLTSIVLYNTQNIVCRWEKRWASTQSARFYLIGNYHEIARGKFTIPPEIKPRKIFRNCKKNRSPKPSKPSLFPHSNKLKLPIFSETEQTLIYQIFNPNHFENNQGFVICETILTK